MKKPAPGFQVGWENIHPPEKKQRRAGLKAIIDELAAIDRAPLTASQKISLQLVETGVGNAYAPATVVDYGSVLGEYGLWFIPYVVSHLTGPHIEIPAILEDKMAVRTKPGCRCLPQTSEPLCRCTR